ncbi:Mannose-p-dolichol utilization defect 1 protein [Lasiodiplodia theobromae]|uniref:Mannose-p-dolichol utilization defect 1 protein n=1 Tax=Lasiodiplodia theobromae TaxID=45133 RepID=UPI0015C3BA1F|nr:Mannose-p-dolichol utilization defect 1 protein [Lasiodiplodia theobromae]KAF4540862.1 Mannose-p-dolichol utilization defect 1 protein [Lasiodiplodia theobromae]
MDAALDSVRTALQPITHNLPEPIHDAGLSLLGPKCYQKLIKDIDPVNYPECVKLAISKGLGIGIIGASSIVKVPQLIKLLRSQSAEGLSFLAYLLETSSYLIGLAYNARMGFPFSTYGETALIAVQNVAIAALVLHFKGKDAGAAAWVAGLAAAGYALFDKGIVDEKTLAALQAAGGMLSIASKAPQIVEVYRQGGTGQLSAFAVFNYLLGSLSRIFTTIQEVGDQLVLFGFVAGFLLNAVLAIQMIYYWNAPASRGAKAGSKSKNKNKKKAEKPVQAKEKDSGKPLATSTASSKGKSPSTRRRG